MERENQKTNNYLSAITSHLTIVLMFQSPTRPRRSSTAGSPGPTPWGWRRGCRCLSLTSRRPSPGNSTSHDQSQWAPSPCCRWCSSSRDTRATSSSRWGQCWWPNSPIVSQVYLPCALIVVLSWVGFWLNREATSDRVTLGEVLYRGELLKSMSYYYPAS